MFEILKNRVFGEDKQPMYDRQIFFLAITLISIGFIMIFSASITQATNKFDDPFFFAKKDLLSVVMALISGFVILFIPGEVYKRYNFGFLIFGIVLLLVLLVVGTEVNKAKRWIRLGGINIQPSEIMKFCWIVYLSSFLTRKREEVTTKLRAFIKQCFIFAVIVFLMLCQPDYGSAVVVFGILFGLLWVGGAHIYAYVFVVVFATMAMILLMLFEPYRILRLTTFLNPWENPFGSGYQLTQSLMAFGRGGLLGEGLGNSVQKMEYLPEAHTDFVVAILAEEFGYLGVCFVIFLELWLVCRLFVLSKRFLLAYETFAGYISFGIGLMIAMQTVINIGAASGMLPTKGLTLPLISYGGSSMMVMVVALALVLRLDYEFKLSKRHKTSVREKVR